MKKMLLIITILLFICGCKERSINCKIDVDNKDLNYKLSGEYKIYYKKSFVTKIEKKEKYISDDRDVIKYLSESKDIELNSLNDNYGGYDFKIESKTKKLTINTFIDISKTDISKMIKNKYLSKYYVNNDRLTLGGIKLLYESRGATCE